MKIKKSFIGVMSFAAAMTVVTSCGKDETSEPLEPGTAQVSGKLFANLDETTFQKQTVPEGTGITFVVNGEDLDHNPDPTYDYKDVIVRATANADGSYSTTLDAISTPYTADVVFDDFEFEATIITTNDEGFQEVITERRTFSRGDATVGSIVEGKTIVENFDYGNAQDQDFVASGIVRGVVETVYHENVGEPTGTAGTDIDNNGTGYAAGDYEVTGGSGTGMVVQTNGNLDDGYTVIENGEGYTIDDIVTLQGGDDNARLRITGVNTEDEPVPAGVVLTFEEVVTEEKFKVATDEDGRYIIKLPVDTYTIAGADFEAEGTKFEGGEWVTGTYVYQFDGAGNQTVEEGSIDDRDFTYSKKP